MFNRLKFFVADKLIKNDFDEIICPVIKNKPRWWETLRARQTVRSCPAFSFLLKDSFLIKLPCDVLVEKKDGNVFIYSLNELWMNIDNHDLSVQFSESHAKNFLNIKFMLQTTVCAKKPVKGVQLTAFNYTDENEELFRAVEGSFPIIETSTQLNINTFFRISELNKRCESFSEGTNILLKKGTPLCLLYFPEGSPKYDVEVGSILTNLTMHKLTSLKEGMAHLFHRAFN